jgi:leucyl aminopeptidase (aminopeptidase T)
MQNLTRLAQQIVNVCLNIRKGENVWIHSWDHTVDIASETALACRRQGAYPFITVRPEDYWINSLLKTPKKQLENLPHHEEAALAQTDAFIFMLGPRNLIDWNEIPKRKQELANIWYFESNNYLRKWRKIAKQHSIRALGIEYCLATKERSKTLGVNYEEWREVMLAGCLANHKKIADRCSQLAKIIKKGHEVHVQTPSGTHLEFKLVNRNPNLGDSIVSSKDASEGVIKFLPSGFIEVTPDEDSANGTVVFNEPIRVRGTKRIEGLTIEFKNGNIMEYSAQSGIDIFERYLGSAQGDIKKFGFFGLGLNPGLKHGFTQDDKVLGGVTIGIGGNKDKGGNNETTENRHWWASTTHATVQVDNETILKNGRPCF